MTRQTEIWAGSFGREYTDRNRYDPAELDAFYLKTWGVTRTQMNTEFLADVPREARVLEVGANVGNQLRCLEALGFSKLSGVDVQVYALARAKKAAGDLSLVAGVATSLPFREGAFDLVFTSGLLIHVHFEHLDAILDEIYRLSRTYVWGFEYCAENDTEIPYRGHRELLWKRDFLRYFRDRFPHLHLVREKRFPYVNQPNVDSMFLLRKT